LCLLSGSGGRCISWFWQQAQCLHLFMQTPKNSQWAMRKLSFHLHALLEAEDREWTQPERSLSSPKSSSFSSNHARGHGMQLNLWTLCEH
jgi:hypothetical protein